MENLLRNKFFIALLLFILLVFSLFTNCFAISINYSEKSIVLPDISNYDISNSDYEHYLIFKTASSIDADNLKTEDFYLFCFNTCSINSSSNVFSGKGNFYRIIVPDYDFQGNRRVYWACYSSNRSMTFELNNTSKYDFSVYLTDIDIYNTSGNLVFQSTPHQVGQVTIPEIQAVEEIPQVMNKVLEIVIPIGLIVFLVGLLIYLVRLVISRMT